MPENYTPPQDYKLPEVDPVNLSFTPKDLVGQYNTAYRDPLVSTEQSENYKGIFDNLLNQSAPKTGQDLPSVATENIPMTGRFPLYYPGRDNEEMYAQGQSSFDKAKNGVAKMAGIATTTFINGTAGLLYGVYKGIDDGKFSSFYDNELSNSLNDLNANWEDKYAHYRTERERNGSWWEPSNLFTGNFLWDNIVKNLGFSLGAAASGFAWGGAFKAIGLTGKLMGAGAELAAGADTAIAEASALPQVERLSAINSKLESLWNGAKSTLGKGLMKTDRGIVATFGTVGEAGIESLNNSNDFRKNMISEFVKTHGYNPEQSDLDEINKYATSVGNWSFLTNSALLSATNYIQLPKIYSSSFKAEKELANNLLFKEGKYVSSLAEPGFGKFLYKSKNIVSLFFNTSEAFEEGAQYAIQTGTQNYFKKKYNKEQTSALDDSILFGIKQALTTDEGLQNIFTGGFSGALQSSGFVGIKKGIPTIGGTGKIGERGFTGYGGEQAKLREEAIVAMNNSLIRNKMRDVYSGIAFSEELQKDRDAAIRRGDILESKDLEFDYAHNFITTRLKYNAGEAIKSELSGLRQEASTDAGFLELQQQGVATQTDTKESFINRLINIEQHAENTAKLTDAANLKYKGQVNPKTNERLYSDEVIDKLVYAASKVADYDKRIPQLANDLLKNNIPLIDVLEDTTLAGVSKEEATVDAIAKIDALNTTSDVKDSLKTDLRDSIELSLRRKQFLDEYDEIKSNPEKYTTVEEKELPSLDNAGVTTIKLTTIDEDDKDVVIGTDYYAGKEISVKEKDGTISKFTQFKVLGETEDGKIRVQAKNGTITQISKDVFKKYKLGKVADTNSKPNAKFFIESSDGIFTYNIGKKGENPVGFITYDKTTDKLFFESNDGKFKRQVTRDQFSPKKGFDVAQIWSSKKYTAKAEEALQEVVSVDEKMATRNKIIVDLYEGAKEALEKKTKKLEDSKKSLNEIITKLKETQASEKSTPSQNLLAIKRVLSSLTDEKIRLEKEIKELENQKEELEGTIPYFQELLDNQKDLPEAGSELLQDLRNELAVLNELVENTKDSIKTGKSLLKTVEDALSTALSTLDKFISGLVSSNPKAPLYLEDLQVQLERFYGEEGAKNIIAEREGFTDAVLDLQERIATQTEKLKIPNLQSKTEKLDEQLKELQAGLTELSNEFKAKQQILQAFEKYAEQAKKQKQEEEKLIKDKELFKDLSATLSTDTQNDVRSTPFEQSSKKPDISVVGGTVPIDTGKAHQKRANTFGFKYPSMKNTEDIKGVIVTKNNQDSLIPGLVEHLTVGGGDPETVIALVMVIDNGNGTFTPVDENGERILTKNGAGEDVDLVNSAIYQVFPGDSLTQDYRDGKGRTTMFRESTPENVKAALTEQYVAWRKEKLAQTTLGEPQKFFASFGSPDYVKLSDGKNDETARTSVDEAGLVSNNTLRLTPVLKVATTNTSVSNGTVTFDGKNNLGKVFLEVPGGLAKLFNNKLTAKKANTVFEVILQLTKNASAEKGGIKSLKSKTLLNWLSANVYWGIAKDKDGNRIEGGYNNIWFEQVADENNQAVTKLYISGKDKSFLFTPTSIEANKDAILKALGNLYHNTNATKVNENKFNDPYYDIISIDEEGNPVVEEWANYQSYLLSNKSADGKTTRNTEDIPLATKFRPLKEEGDVNRKNIYFTLSGATESYDIPEPEVIVTRTAPTAPVVTGDAATQIEALLDKKKTTGLTPSEIATLAQLQKGEVPITTPKPPSVQEYDLTGEKKNTVTLNSGPVSFTINAQTYIDTGGEKGFAVDIPISTIAAFQEKKKQAGTPISEDEAVRILSAVAFSKVAPIIEGMKIPVEPAIKDEVVAPEAVIATPTAPVVPVSDIEAKKAELKYSISQLKKDLQSRIDDFVTKGASLEEATKLAYNEFPKQDKASLEKLESELAALEGGEKPAAETKDSAFRNRQRGNGSRDDAEYRLALREDVNKFEGENWKKLEEWVKANFPNVPIYRVKNAIKATGNKKAWGLLKDGAIYVYENAQVGTIYHEVFEAVWKSFSTFKERQAIISEFKNRQGSYFDVFSERNIKYSEATDREIKEQLAEEFRDFVQEKKLPPRPVSGKSWIAAMFSDLINAIKNLFLGAQGANNTERLFNKIGSGGFSKYNPYENQLSYAKKGIIDIEDVIAGPNDELRLEIDVPQEQVHELMQQMTYITLERLSRNNKSLFGIQKQGRKQLYASLKENVLRTIGNEGDAIEQDLVDKKITPEAATQRLNNIETLYNNVDANWAEVAKKHEEYLQAYSVKFDDNDDAILTDEDNSGKADYLDARRIDSFRKANSAIRLLLATLPITRKNAAGDIKIVRNSIGGVTLLPVDKVHITLLNKLHDSRDIEEMLERLKNIAEGDSNYASLFERLTKSTIREGVDLSKLDNTHDWQLLTSFYKAFKKQNADNQIVFILSNGQVVVGDGSLSSAARQSKNDMFNDLISKLKSGSPYITYSAKKYNVNNNLGKVALSAKAGDIKTYTSFLENIGIFFTPKELSKLTDNQVKTFREATEGIKTSMAKYKDLASLNKQTLDIDGQLLKLGTIRAILDNPEFKSTYFNVNGERSQTYIGTNTLSNFYDFISKVKNINELEGTEYKYLLTDVFTGAKTNGSVILNAMFDIAGDGSRKSGTEDLLKTGYVDGTVNETNNKKKESSKLNPKERLIQEINLNLEGQYLNLVPGDASIEWMVKMINSISVDTLINTGDSKVFEIFKNYFMSEVALSRDGRDIVEIKLTDKEKKEGKEQRKSTDLRFFKGILGKDLHDEIVAYATDLAKSPEEVYLDYAKEINKAVKDFIDKETKETRETLEQYGIISLGEEGLEVENLAFSKEENISEEDLDINLKALSINYIVANIEFHKLIYSDPYQYKDELKRVKSFNSPGQSIIANSKKANASINAVYNKGYKPGDVGYTDMTADHFNSTTSEDINGISDLENYGIFEETDGGGYITMKANRVFRIRAGNWNDKEELQYRYDVAYYKTIKGTGLSQQEKEEQGLVLSKEEQKLYLGKNPEVRSAYTPIKPIVAGNKDDGENFNDVALHKFALVPLSFRILHQMNPESNAVKFVEKMESEGIDYTVFASGAKVGGGIATPLYTEKGDLNTEPFREVNRIPFSIMRVQAEVPSKEAAYVTQGSQITKLATMDFMEAGVPIDFDPSITDINDRFVAWMKLSEKDKMKSEIYREIKNNQRILEAKIEQGYSTLLKKLSIEKTKDGFIIKNVDKLTKTLSDEILKREVNENILDAFAGFKKGEVVLEATPAYQQIRNILYSIADKNVVRPKITGGQKVQIPSTLFEGTKNEAKKIIRKDGKETLAYESDVLDFYVDEDGKRVCEIMIGRWFKSDMTDEALLKYLNTTDEGKKILSGVAFRIPTQKQNSIDVFRIKKFLPTEFGDSVVIPSALVKKVGSDFDIDKLSIYLKNLYKSGDGSLKMVPFFGFGEEAKKKIADFLLKEDLESIFDIKDVTKFDEEEGEQKEEKSYEDVADKMYSESLENEYIQSLQNLISHPLNFKNLTKPNSAKELQDLANEIVELTGGKEFDYSSTISMLSRTFMSNLRQAFVNGKQGVGIAAVAQTNNSQAQRGVTYIDDTRLTQDDERISDLDKKILGNGEIKFEKYNSIFVNGKKRPTISIAINQAGNYISDIIGQFIDGYVDIAKGPWIMQLGAKPNVSNTWLFLARIGVPIKTVAYFMNQPIIKEYLSSIENAGYSWLFIDKFVEQAKESYAEGNDIVVTDIPSETLLKGTLGGKKLTPQQQAEQRFMLDEFLKYAKMAEHLFKVQQGSNFDTAVINDSSLVFKKKMQLAKARNTIFAGLNDDGEQIDGVDSIINNSFIKVLRDTIYDIRDAFADTVLISDRKSVRQVIEAVTTPYIDLNDRDFVKLSQKAVSDLFDWAVQTDRKINTNIQTILLGTPGVKSAAEEIMALAQRVKKDPDPNNPLRNNLILNSIKRISGDRENVPDNLEIMGNYNKVYDQNQIIDAFLQLKKELVGEDKAIYGKLVRLAVLQSGLTNSPISFTSLIPYEDFKEIYNQTLSTLEKMPNLNDFYTLNVFQRNNWSDSNIVPFKKAEFRQSKKTKKWYYNMDMKGVADNLKTATAQEVIPQMLNISPMSREGASDFLVYTYEKQLSKNKEENKRLKAEAKKKGDTSYIVKYLFKKVYNSFGEPLIQTDDKNGVIYEKYVYKAINAWGASFRANEFYDKLEPGDPLSTTGPASVIDNGFVKLEAKIKQIRSTTSDEIFESKYGGEVEDNIIETTLNNGAVPITKKVVPLGDTGEQYNIEPGYGLTAANFEDYDRGVSNFQGYKGEFVNTGKGTVEGDGKDKAMRQVADGFIGEIVKANSSSQTSRNTIIDKFGVRDMSQSLPTSAVNIPLQGKSGAKVIMLARNNERKNQPITEETKYWIRNANIEGSEFVVGDMPEVDSQFIDYLQEIGAKFTVYHTGSKPRIQITSKPTQAASKQIQPEGKPAIDNTNKNNCG